MEAGAEGEGRGGGGGVAWRAALLCNRDSWRMMVTVLYNTVMGSDRAPDGIVHTTLRLLAAALATAHAASLARGAEAGAGVGGGEVGLHRLF